MLYLLTLINWLFPEICSKVSFSFISYHVANFQKHIYIYPSCIYRALTITTHSTLILIGTYNQTNISIGAAAIVHNELTHNHCLLESHILFCLSL